MSVYWLPFGDPCCRHCRDGPEGFRPNNFTEQELAFSETTLIQKLLDIIQ